MRLLFAVIFITLALVFYTWGVFGERAARRLMRKHLVLFWLGLTCDTIGTTLMSQLAEKSGVVNFHSVTGTLAILLMAIHAIWATVVLLRGSEKSKADFSRLSIFVWMIWLVPYLSGMFYGMVK